MRTGGGALGASLAFLRLLPRCGVQAACGGASAGRALWSAGRAPWSCRRRSSSGPPWRLLFFGSDQFAVESLKVLEANRSSKKDVVASLEVVTLSDDVPVSKFAEQKCLPVHRWPLGDVDKRFDVGVVVSFGCLLQERLIAKFPHGVLNVHPSLLPRWRGPAPVFHTILHGDAVTGVTIMQIRPHRFDVGPILNQELHQVQERCTAEELANILAVKGAQLLMDTLRTLPQKMADKREQSQTGATIAPKISWSMSWVEWEEQTCEQIDCLYRAIGSKIPLRTTWMGHTVKLLDFVGKCHISLADPSRKSTPGSVSFQKESNVLAVCCKDGWVGFKAVILKKLLTAADFHNGYLHQTLQRHQTPPHQAAGGVFSSRRGGTEAPHGEAALQKDKKN
ncbi:methionyl-tRNA formyltransferase, mitochondrial isoform X2 [Nerophis ophidion]|uniref:methionyl-tRNA formyltransferase, mitochondrial isoform X2 n=1 Tax=Nerophis ophidion TaxID=159077 RepID=UPI002AE08D7A|nr:methionyl-tRNA formyltransferase, mitochondrial isoform X2 [Nerophis ophidion]